MYLSWKTLKKKTKQLGIGSVVECLPSMHKFDPQHCTRSHFFGGLGRFLLSSGWRVKGQTTGSDPFQSWDLIWQVDQLYKLDLAQYCAKVSWKSTTLKSFLLFHSQPAFFLRPRLPVMLDYKGVMTSVQNWTSSLDCQTLVWGSLSVSLRREMFPRW
jgi:hypothetical protein